MTKIREELALKIENRILKMQALKQQWDAFEAEQRALIEEARKEVNAPAGHVLVLETRIFQPPQVRPFAAPAKREKKRAQG